LLLVREQTLQPHILLAGTLEAVESVRISVPPVAHDTVEVKWLVTDGARVRAGDPLVELDPAVFAAAVENLRLDLLQSERELTRARAAASAAMITAESAVRTARLRLTKAELDAGVPRALFADVEFERRRLALERARADLAAAESDLEVLASTTAADVGVAEVELATARRRLELALSSTADLTIRAPRDGLFIIGENRWEGRKIQIGDTLWVGWALGSMPILDRMQVRAALSDVDDGKVAVGTRVQCTLDSEPTGVFAGTVASIGAIAQEPDYVSRRRFFDVIVSLDAHDPERLRPGMSARIAVPMPAVEDALIVPRLAIDASGDRFGVRLLDGTWVPVGILTCSAADCAVTGDLAPGDGLLPAGDAA